MADQTIACPCASFVELCAVLRVNGGTNWPLLKKLTIEETKRTKTQNRSALKVGTVVRKSWLRVGLITVGQGLQKYRFYE
jgi:hypothetical protein